MSFLPTFPTFPTRPRRARLSALALLACAAVSLSVAHAAAALPASTGTGTNPPPPPPTPVASFAISPNPAIVTLQPVLTQARALITGAGPVSIYGSGDLVTFDASASHGDSPIVSYQWDLDGDGSFETAGATARIETRHFSRTGSFAIHLRVTSADGQSSTTTRTLVVHNAPHAEIHAQRTTITIGGELKLAPNGSTGDPGIAHFDWDMPGSNIPHITTSWAEIVPATYQQAGQHTITLHVTDTLGATATTSIVVTVEHVPTASFTDAPSPAQIGETVHFDASGSTADSAITDYAWDLDGDGTFETDSGTSPTVSLAYAHPGRYDVSLRIVDALGFGATVTRELVVEPIPTLPVTAGPAPRVAIAPRAALGRGATVSIAVTCPRGERLCRGRVAVAALHASGAFDVGSGQTAHVRLRVNAAARRRLSSHHRPLRVGVRATVTDAAGHTATTTATVAIS